MYKVGTISDETVLAVVWDGLLPFQMAFLALTRPLDNFASVGLLLLVLLALGENLLATEELCSGVMVELASVLEGLISRTSLAGLHSDGHDLPLEVFKLGLQRLQLV